MPSTSLVMSELTQTSATSERSGTSYLHSRKTIEHVTQVLLRAAARGSLVSQPVALVWGILLQELRDRASALIEDREARQTQRVMAGHGVSQASDTESNESFSERKRPAANRRTSSGSDTSQAATPIESIIEAVQRIDGQEDIMQTLARSAFSGQGAFSTISDLASSFCLYFGRDRQGLLSCQLRTLLLQTVEATLRFVEYGSDLVSTILDILSGGCSSLDRINNSSYHASQQPAAVFLRTPALMEKVLDQAVFRFPFELVPLLKLCTALMGAIPTESGVFLPLELLKELTHYTTAIPETGYSLVEDDAMYITLRVSLPVDWNPDPLRPENSSAPAIASDNASGAPERYAKIAQGAQGIALTDHKPIIARFATSFSGYRYLGRILQRASNAYYGMDKSRIGPILEAAIEVLSLLTVILDMATKQTDDSTNAIDAYAILEDFSDGLDDGNDVISVIFNILENELHEQHAVTYQGEVTEVLVACTSFTCTLLRLQPSRVWPFLGRSSLLGLDGVESHLLSVVAAREIPVGRFPFLIANTHLFEALVEDVVTHSVSRRKASTTVVRFGESPRDNTAAGIKDAIMAKILHNFTKLMIDIFETAGGWRIESGHEVIEIYATVCRALDRILGYSFNVDDEAKPSRKLAAVLAPAAEYVVGVFLFNHQNTVPLEPFLQILERSLGDPDATLDATGKQSQHRMTTGLIGFAEHLIRVNAYLGHARSQLEKQLFARAELLVHVFAGQEDYRLPIVRLLHALLIGPCQNQDQPPSLLGHLGQEVAVNFIELLSGLDGPLGHLDFATALWKLLSAVVTQQQQWFAILLLSGETAREYLRKKDGKSQIKSQARSLLDVAMGKLRHLEAIDPREAVGILEFLSVAADYWPWVSHKIESNAGLVKEFTSLVVRLGDSRKGSADATSTLRALRLQMTASVTKILAIIVHRGNEMKTTAFAQQISPYLRYLVEEGTTVTSYNASLHSSLEKNFGAKYSNCKLSNFKRTAVSPSQLGPEFFYDVEFAKKVFAFDRSWSRSDGRGFADEFERANINLSYVQTQIVSKAQYSLSIADFYRICLGPGSR